MVRSSRSPSMRALRKDIRVYAPKASCLVLTASERMDFAQFCLILLTAEQKIKRKEKTATKEQGPNKIGYLKTKGSQTSGPFLLKIEKFRDHFAIKYCQSWPAISILRLLSKMTFL